MKIRYDHDAADRLHDRFFTAASNPFLGSCLGYGVRLADTKDVPHTNTSICLYLCSAFTCHHDQPHFLSGQQRFLVPNENKEAKKKGFSSKYLAPRKDSVYEMFRSKFSRWRVL